MDRYENSEEIVISFCFIPVLNLWRKKVALIPVTNDLRMMENNHKRTQSGFYVGCL